MSAVLPSRWSPWTVAILAASGSLVLIVLALLVGTGNSNGHGVLLALAIILAPGLLALTLRAPLVFPFSLYVALVPLDRILAVSGAGGTLTRFAGIMAAGALVVAMALGRRAIAPGRALAAWIAVIAWCTATIFWSAAPAASALEIGQLAMLAVLTILLACYVPRRRELLFAFGAIVISATIASLYGLRSFETGTVFVNNRLTIAGADGGALDPNYLSTSLLPGFAIALASAIATRRLWLRGGALGCALIVAAAIILSGSRGCFLAMAVISAITVTRMRSRTWAMSTIGAGVALVALFPTVLMRFLSDPSGDESSGSGRTFLWSIGLHALKNSFLFGAGIGAFPTVYNDALLTVPQRLFQGWSRPAHNVFVSSLVELGVVGTVLLIAAVAGVFRTLDAVDEPALQPLRIAVAATMWGIIVQSFFIDEITLKVVWLNVGLAFVLFNASRSVRS